MDPGSLFDDPEAPEEGQEEPRRRGRPREGPNLWDRERLSCIDCGGENGRHANHCSTREG